MVIELVSELILHVAPWQLIYTILLFSFVLISCNYVVLSIGLIILIGKCIYYIVGREYEYLAYLVTCADPYSGIFLEFWLHFLQFFCMHGLFLL